MAIEFVIIDDDNVRVQGATIYLERLGGDGMTTSGVTDKFGTYRFENVPQGNYQFAVMKKSQINPLDNFTTAVGTISTRGQYMEYPIRLSYSQQPSQVAPVEARTKNDSTTPPVRQFKLPQVTLVANSALTFPIRAYDALQKGNPMPKFMQGE
jgi:hypothetical protein